MASKLQSAKQAIVELERALTALKDFEKEAEREKNVCNVSASVRGKAKRASMDATRALANFRKVGNYE